MDTSIKVSIGLPVYNARKYIRESINSILQQSYSNFELIISNDGSTDDSWAIIKTILDPRIIYINDSVNRGISYRLNEQIQLSSGKYFVRMDADDVMFPDRIEKQVSFLEKNPEVHVVGCSAVIINDYNQIVGIRAMSNRIRLSYFIKTDFFIHPSIMGHTTWFKKNLYSDNFNGAEDFELFLRCYRYSVYKQIEEPLLFYRQKYDLEIKTYLLRQSKVIAAVRANKNVFKYFYHHLVICFSTQLKIKFILLIHTIKGLNGFNTLRIPKLSSKEEKKYILILQKVL